jgi:heme-degrading monooxygenase HmoA
MVGMFAQVPRAVCDIMRRIPAGRTKEEIAMVVTVFRSRLKPGAKDQYLEWAQRMAAIARTMPGYVSHKGFTAEDGERVTIVEFRDEESQRAWATQAQHVEAKKKGRADFYEEYKVQVCTVVRESAFTAKAARSVAD